MADRPADADGGGAGACTAAFALTSTWVQRVELSSPSWQYAAHMQDKCLGPLAADFVASFTSCSYRKYLR